MTEVAAKPRPRVLLVYYSYTGQSAKVLQAAGEVLADRGCQVDTAAIEFTDARYAPRFSRFPMRHVWRDLASVLPAQLRRVTGEIRTPDEVRAADYDLICIGSATWWKTVNMPMRSFLESGEAGKLFNGRQFAVFVVCRRFWKENLVAVRELAEKQGGRYAGEVHFTYPGGEVGSFLSLTSYLGSGEHRHRYWGVPIPPTNVQPEQLRQTREFAAVLADGLFDGASASPGGGSG